jgi:hypothetical protein
MNFSLQVVTPAVILALASTASATGTPSQWIRRLDSSEAVILQPKSGPCIDRLALVQRGRMDRSTKDGRWPFSLHMMMKDPLQIMTWALDSHSLGIHTVVGHLSQRQDRHPHQWILVFRNRSPFGGTAFTSPFLADTDTCAKLWSCLA